ncbi:hypothetical protein P9578_03400 [Brevibacillus choshinensis]|uniref:hypothetical protein n=1 Tax=Brevibacillus choshinensis TaxID=54911 RepID=UPI002E1F2B45|nr:hypothetical protein [Brevibacillus choshinensis]
MRLFRFVPLGLLLLVAVLSFTGCSMGSSPISSGSPGTVEPASPPAPELSPVTTEPAPSPTPSPASVEWRREEIPYNYDEMKEDVRIQLDEEPQLHSPMRTTVGTTPQAYTFFFREPMDRSSVEAAIRLHAKEKPAVHYVEPVFSFHWVNDRQLHVLATLTNLPDVDRAGPEYVLDAAGSKTLKGKEIGEELAFYALVLVPSQIWQISLDGAQKEKLTAFTAPYFVSNVLDNEHRFLLTYRYRQYCECDARYIPLYAVYDLNKKELIRYPIELTVNYRGKGAFVADRRGFFYAKPEKGVQVPESEWTVPVDVKGFVHGASFSHDRRYVLMAVGAAEQQKNLDLVITDLETGSERRMPGVVKGTIPTSESDGVILPVTFDDDGRYATFMMRENADSLNEIRQRYDWKAEKVISWNPPVAQDSWSGYYQSDDGKYQMYFNGGLYQGTNPIREFERWGIWIPGTHLLGYAKWEEGKEGKPSTESLIIFDADQRQERVILDGLHHGFGVFGASQDGKWLFVQSEQDLAN